ncbi:TIM barrel protein [Litoreibacter albidus]|uniref:TIM barrel protein n=1 Tax=Litoreibacter albidus TaxID=670155 RepID=UPI003736110B
MTASTLSAHLGYLFTNLPLMDRFSKARGAGFDCVEHPAPFDISPSEMVDLLETNGLKMAQISSGMGRSGEKGLASLPDREDEFKEGFSRALDYAEHIGCPFVHAMAGVKGDETTYLKNIDVAQKLSEGRTPELLIEAISSATVPDYFMSDVDRLLDLATSRKFKVLIDTFHACAMQCDPADAIRRAGSALGHVHIADFPGRAEPGTGTTNFQGILSALDAIAFSGAIGFEYVPSGQHHLNWMTKWTAHLRAQQSTA